MGSGESGDAGADDHDRSDGVLMRRCSGGCRYGGAGDPDADAYGEGSGQGLHADSIGI